DQVLFNRARALCAHYESAAIDVDNCLGQIHDRCTPSHRAALVNFAIEIATASGGIKRREREFLAKVSCVLQVPLPPIAVRSEIYTSASPGSTPTTGKPEAITAKTKSLQGRP